jgi:hypothetical protein
MEPRRVAREDAHRSRWREIGKLQDVYVDVATDEPQFGTVEEGLIGRHLTFVPLGGIKVGPDDLQVAVSRQQVKDAPNIEQHGDSSPKPTSRRSTTTTSSTTPRPPRRADADSRAADGEVAHEAAELAGGAQLPPVSRGCGSAFGLLAFGADPDDVPGEVAVLQTADQPGAGVELPPAESVSG